MSELYTISVTTDSSGDFSINTGPVIGRVVQYRYVPDGTSPLATGADLTIEGATTGISVASQSNIGTSAFTKAPRQGATAQDGSALLYASGGEAVPVPIIVIGEQLSITIAQGGASTAGTIYIWVD